MPTLGNERIAVPPPPAADDITISDLLPVLRDDRDEAPAPTACSLLVVSQEVRAVPTLAHSASRSGQRLDLVGVVPESHVLPERRRQPPADRLGEPAPAAVRSCARRRGWPPVVGVGIVAGDAEQHRRHAEGERDLARRRVLGRDEVHVLGRRDSAFQSSPPSSSSGRPACAAPRSSSRARPSAARTARRVRLPPSLALINKCARGPRRIVEQRLVPARRRHCGCRAPSPPPRSARSHSGR